MRRANPKDYVICGSIFFGSTAVGLLLAILAYRLQPAVQAQWSEAKPLCVVCDKRAVRQTEGVYTIKGTIKHRQKSPIASLPADAKPAWLCKDCNGPPKIAGDLPVIRGAYASREAHPTGGAGLQQMCAILGAIMCFGLGGVGLMALISGHKSMKRFNRSVYK